MSPVGISISQIDSEEVTIYQAYAHDRFTKFNTALQLVCFNGGTIILTYENSIEDLDRDQVETDIINLLARVGYEVDEAELEDQLDPYFNREE